MIINNFIPEIFLIIIFFIHMGFIVTLNSLKLDFIYYRNNIKINLIYILFQNQKNLLVIFLILIFVKISIYIYNNYNLYVLYIFLLTIIFIIFIFFKQKLLQKYIGLNFFININTILNPIEKIIQFSIFLIIIFLFWYLNMNNENVIITLVLKLFFRLFLFIIINKNLFITLNKNLYLNMVLKQISIELKDSVINQKNEILLTNLFIFIHGVLLVKLIVQEKISNELIYSPYFFHLLFFYLMVFLILSLLKIYIILKKIYIFNKLTTRSKKIVLCTFFLRRDNTYIADNLFIPWKWYLQFLRDSIRYLKNIKKNKK